MRNFIKILIISCFLIGLFVFFKSHYSEHSVAIKDEKLTWNLKYKGIEDAKDIAVDDKGNLYIAYTDRIQFVDGNGKSFDIIKDKELNIYSLEYKNEKLYYSSGSKILCYDLDKKQQIQLIGDLPNYGDYNKSLIKIRNDELYISIGAATNSGVVGNDNFWINNSPFNYDITPKDITVRGKSFGSEKTGAFVPYKTKNATGQLMPGHFPGNASIIYYNLIYNSADTFSWGIRNVKGMSFNSEGKLIAAVGGIEDRGLRPVKGDVDYIYEIKKGLWYGWPDYSGGDPLTSPRFKGVNNSKVNFILDNHPSTNPPAPIYQHKSLSTLGSLDVDLKGRLGEKDCIYFYDNRDNILYGLTKSGILKEKVVFKKDTNIASIKISDGGLLALDSSNGTLYNIKPAVSSEHIKLNKTTIYYLIIFIVSSIIIVVWKSNAGNK